MRESRERYRALVENLPGAVFRSALHYPWHVSFVSQEIERIAGIEADRLLRGEVEYGTLIHPDDRQVLEQAINASMAARRPYNCVYRLRHADGSWRWVQERGQVMRDLAGQPLWLEGVSLDITELKSLQEEQQRLSAQVQQAQKMEALGQLTGGIAHDFNNILAAVLGFARLALRRHVPDPAGELAECLGEVIAAGERGRDLVARMLDFSRARPQRPAPPIALPPLVEEAVKMLRATIPATIALEVHAEADLPQVAIDPVDLQQVLINLVINARDAVAGQGRIDIQLGRETAHGQVCDACHARMQGEFLVLGVADDGEGIAAEVLPRIFEPFFTTKAVGQGSGMGLAVVHGLVCRAGGHFQVSSRLGQGTTLRVFLPLAPGYGSGAAARNKSDRALDHDLQ